MQLEPLLFEAGAGIAGVPEAAKAVEAAQDEVSDLVEGAPLAFELPLWAADTVRMRMVQQTLVDLAGEAGQIDAGDVELALQLVQLALDTAESAG
jgi:hypothetical protein